MNTLSRGGIRRWVVVAVAALTVVFALLLAHMFETAHPANEASNPPSSSVPNASAPSAADAPAASVLPTENGVPHDQMLVLGCVLGVAATALALAFYVCVLRRDLRLVLSRIMRRLGAFVQRERPLAPSLASLAISRT